MQTRTHYTVQVNKRGTWTNWLETFNRQNADQAKRALNKQGLKARVRPTQMSGVAA